MTALQTGERLEVFSNSTMLTVYNLQPYTVYTCVSAAVTNAGRGSFSDAIQIQTLEAGKGYTYSAANFDNELLYQFRGRMYGFLYAPQLSLNGYLNRLTP